MASNLKKPASPNGVDDQDLAAQPSGFPASSLSDASITPEEESPQDVSLIPMHPNSAKLLAFRLKNTSSPLPSIQCQTPSTSLERPAAEEPMAIKHSRRKVSSSDDLLVHRGNPCSSSTGKCMPYKRLQQYKACPNSMARHSRQNTMSGSGSDLRARKSTLLAKERHDSLMENNLQNPIPHRKHANLSEHKDSKLRMSDSFEGNIGDPQSQLISQDALHLRGKNRYPGIPLKPEFSPISQEQLAAEVKGIYAGLVMVEAKCINIDSQKAARPEEPLSTEQWQALVALHRTLLYEHHDFLMATQHPSANPALLGLATKYSMPARMWKHGIHAFLEVLRHRRPDSQEYMLAFIYLAYQMMSLLLETVPSFTDTWIECLGDLARYRMAIEEDREIHTIWGGVAGRWYVMAADRHPSVGRLYHHSGILERPSLRKFYLYSRALTSVVPFLNARESLRTLCSPVLTDEQGLPGGNQSAEAMIMCFHARVFAGRDPELTKRDGNTALALLKDQATNKIANFGVALAVTNIAAMFDFGTPENIYRQLYDSVLSRDILDSRPSQGHACASETAITPMLLSLEKFQWPQDSVQTFCSYSFNSIIQRTPSRELLIDLLPYLHIMLVFFTSTNTLRSRLTLDDESRNTFHGLFDSSDVDWFALSHFLNLIARSFPITSRTEVYASGETFPRDGIPLSEDYMIRGLVWAQWYFAPDWFANIEDDDGSRCLEDDYKKQHRAARVLYLGMVLAQKSDVLTYDKETRHFSAVQTSDEEETLSATQSPHSVSAPSGGDSSTESDYVLV
ncbi:hypothetical protein Q7P37_010319 [Cladosporium fusiforme]